MQNTPFRAGPLALTNTYTTNILNPGTTTGGVASTSAPYDKLFILLKHIRVSNITGSAATFRLFLGATGANAAGTELAYGLSVPANSYVDLWYQNKKLTTSDFLVGGASASTTLTIEIEGEIGVGT